MIVVSAGITVISTADICFAAVPAAAAAAAVVTAGTALLHAS